MNWNRQLLLVVNATALYSKWRMKNCWRSWTLCWHNGCWHSGPATNSTELWKHRSRSGRKRRLWIEHWHLLALLLPPPPPPPCAYVSTVTHTHSHTIPRNALCTGLLATVLPLLLVMIVPLSLRLLIIHSHTLLWQLRSAIVVQS